MEKIKTAPKPDRYRIYAAAVFLVFVYYMVKQANESLWYSIYCVYYLYLSPVLIAFGLYFSRKNKPVEFKIFTLYCIWLYISRLLNGDYFLTFDGAAMLDLWLGCAFFAVCLVLRPEDRARFLDWLSIAVGGFYTLVGLAVLYGVILRRELTNPVFYGKLLDFEELMSRARVLGKSSNECVMWFFISFFLLLYLFARKKKLLWRMAIVPAAAINYLGMLVTFSRSGRLAFSAGVGLLGAAAILRRLSLKSQGRKVLVSVILTGILMAAAYLSFDLAAAGLRQASNIAVAMVGEEETEAEAVEASPAADEAEPSPATSEETDASNDKYIYQDSRGFDDSGRFEVYKSIIPTIQREPERLFRGCLYQNVMGVANTVLKNYKVHFHNSYIQSLAFTGVPGLLLFLAFSVLLTVKIVKLYFTPGNFELKILSMILVGSFIYNLFEVSLFYYADIRAFSFYLVSGAVLAHFRDKAPA